MKTPKFDTPDILAARLSHEGLSAPNDGPSQAARILGPMSNVAALLGVQEQRELIITRATQQLDIQAFNARIGITTGALRQLADSRDEELTPESVRRLVRRIADQLEAGA